MKKVSESIFSGKSGIDTFVIPLARVHYVKKVKWGHNIDKEIEKIRTRYDVYLDKLVVKLPQSVGKEFMKAWCYYRYEIEGGAKVVSVDKIYDILDSVIYRQFQFKNKLMNDDDIRNLAKEIANLTKQEG